MATLPNCVMFTSHGTVGRGDNGNARSRNRSTRYIHDAPPHFLRSMTGDTNIETFGDLLSLEIYNLDTGGGGNRGTVSNSRNILIKGGLDVDGFR